MTTSSLGRGYLLGVGGLVLGLVIGYFAGLQNGPQLNPSERNLDASLWMQTAGEYRAVCLQTYHNALQRLRQKRVALPEAGLPQAVIMDLDETVLDNSPFQSWLYLNSVEYSDERWAVWEEKYPHEVLLVPGAREFIQQAEASGVTVFYISNRVDRFRASTIRALEHLGLNTRDIERRLLLATNGSDKTARRDKVARGHRVLMLFGDNLRDFSEEFKAPAQSPDDVKGQNAAIAARRRQVDEKRTRFGDDWIILPNPAYGEWTRLIGSAPGENLRQTTMPAQ